VSAPPCSKTVTQHISFRVSNPLNSLSLLYRDLPPSLPPSLPHSFYTPARTQGPGWPMCVPFQYIKIKQLTLPPSTTSMSLPASDQKPLPPARKGKGWGNGVIIRVTHSFGVRRSFPPCLSSFILYLSSVSLPKQPLRAAAAAASPLPYEARGTGLATTNTER